MEKEKEREDLEEEGGIGGNSVSLQLPHVHNLISNIGFEIVCVGGYPPLPSDFDTLPNPLRG